MHISDEDLELYILARLPAHQASALESHLTGCGSCTARLSEVAEVTFKVIRLNTRQRGDYAGAEKRREHRIPSDDPGQMQTFSPFSPAKIQVQIMDVSRNGLKLRTSQFVSQGTIVQVRVKQAIILGEVRYCVAAGDKFDAGIQIQDVVPRRDG
jgi:hypothetical protein